MVHWAWRLFRREWRQQLLILLLVIVAVAAVVVGSAVAVNTPSPASAGYGTADDLATYTSTPGAQGGAGIDLHSVDTQIAALEHRFGTARSLRTRPLASPAATRRTSCAPWTRTGRMRNR